MLLTASTECVATLVGGWRAGLRVASLPLPARAMTTGDYHAQLAAVQRVLEADLLVLDDELAATLPGLPIPVATYGEAMAGGPRAPVGETGSFVQFTSGSTGTPKGVALSLDAIGANCLAIVDAMGAPDRLVCCSWLPISHDMGLVGMLLSTWAGQHAAAAGGITLIQPGSFMRAPDLWLSTCSATRASVTALPPFGLDLAVRRPPAGRIDLRDLSACFVGAEPVAAATLRRFAEAYGPAGLSPTSLRPAYGMAEASLAVTIHPAGSPWVSRHVGASALQEGRWEERPPGGGLTERVPPGGGMTELVGVGPPLPGMEVAIQQGGGGEIGQILVRGASMMSGYVGAADPRDTGGWFPTGDLGRVLDGRLFVTGRADDVILVAGRNLYPHDLEEAAAGVAGVRRHFAAAVPLGHGEYAMVVERPKQADGEAALRALCRDVRRAIVGSVGIGPVSVHVVPSGTFPTTPSGKPRRKSLAASLFRDALPTDMTVHFR
jgi:acyl-CoA synthetase (AMP-forming)/AMP-acid ligase II